MIKRILLALVISVVGYSLLSSKSESYIRERVVKIQSVKGSCSGEQIRAPSGVDYILTAAHCKLLADASGVFTVVTAHGDAIARKLIAEDPASDLLLIEGLPDLKGLDVAHRRLVAEHVRSFTHGKGMATYKTEGELVQDKEIQIITKMINSSEDEVACVASPKFKVVEVPVIFGLTMRACVLSLEETVSTAPTLPGSSGGPVVDDSGDLAGVVSAGGDGFSYLVKIEDINKFLSGY